jgi:hypothetical protein
MKGYLIQEIDNRIEVGCYTYSGKWQLARRFNTLQEAESYAAALNKQFKDIMNDYNEKLHGNQETTGSI